MNQGTKMGEGQPASQAWELLGEKPGLNRETRLTEDLECQTVAFILGLMTQ